MKILTWNCNGAFRKKLEHIRQFDADIYVIQECENTDVARKIYSEWMPNYIWKGKNIHKGLAVFAKKEYLIEELNWADDVLELFLPVKIDSKIQLLAIWTKYANSPTFQYIGQLWKYLQLNQQNMLSSPMILVGDLNSNACWDRWWNHSDVVNHLKSMGIESVYHKTHSEKHGEETQSTFYLQRKYEKNYHIDYLFSSVSLFDVSKSTSQIFDKSWLDYSDHLPILFEVN